MAIRFDGGGAGRLEMSGTSLQNGAVPILIVIKAALRGYGPNGFGRWLNNGDRSIDVYTSGSVQRLACWRSRTAGDPHLAQFDLAPWEDEQFRTLALQWGSAPTVTPTLYVEGTEEPLAVAQVNDSGVYNTGGNDGRVVVGNRGDDPNREADADFEHVWVWRDLAVSTDIQRALSTGINPLLLGLPAPTFAVELPGSVRSLSGHSVLTNDNAGYVAGGGYSAYPNSPIYPALQAPSTPVQYNLGKHQFQALPITIGAGVGV